MNETLDPIIQSLTNPDAEFTPIPFWFFNDRPDQEKIRNQLADFADKGVHGLVLHPRIGIPAELPYLSEAYFDAVSFIVKTAAELSMRIVLYDEGMYPSGSCHGEVVKRNPGFASTGILLTDDPDSGNVLASYEDGTFLVSRHSGGTIRGIHFGEDDGEPGAPMSADILNPAAVDLFIELTHERYYSHLKEYFGTVIIGFFTDEPCVLGRNAGRFRDWTEGFEADLKSAGGTVKDLRALFENEENETVRIYRMLIRKRLNVVYYKKLSDWCTAHGIALMGHPQHSDDIDEEQHFHIPGQDLIFRMVSPELGGIDGMDSVQAKCSADMARHYGRRRNSNECFGVCIRDQIPWYMTSGDMKWFIDWLGIRGVNLFIPHAFFYSVEGRRKDERPPDAGPNNIWWKYYKKFSDYMKRISWLMTDSKNAARTAVLCESGKMPYEEMKPFYENQIEFNYLPAALLPECTAKNGKLLAGGGNGGFQYEYDYVMNAGSAALDPSVKIIHGIEDVGKRDFFIQPSCRNLRVTHLEKCGVDLYFVHNEGNTAVSGAVTVPVMGDPVVFDLWDASFYRAERCCAEKCAESNTNNNKKSYDKNDETEEQEEVQNVFLLSLKPFETKLILFDCSGTLNAPKKPAETDITGLCGRFTLCAQDPVNFIKEYRAEYRTDSVTGTEIIAVTGEEMAECWCGGEFAGVSFWNTHEFKVGNLLREGTNEIRIRFTGSAANRYSGQKLDYGMDTAITE